VTNSVQHESSVGIERWTNVYVVPPDHPAPHEPQARLDRFVSSEVRHACAARLGDWLDDADPAVCIIRELCVDLALDPAASREVDIASVWGGRVAIEIRRAVESTTDSANVVRFSSRAAYIAHWARDMANGRAWDQWYYAEFQSLRSLPTSAAIAEAILREPDELPRILTECVSMRCLQDVLGAIHESAAARVFRALLDTPTTPASVTHWVPRLLAICNRSSLADLNEPFRDALRLYTAARTEWPDTGEHGTAKAIEGLLNLRRTLASFPSLSTAQEFLRACANGNREEARRIASAVDVPLDEPALSFALHSVDHNPEWTALAARHLASAIDNPFSAVDSFLTQYGGIFLLGPSFLDLDINGACLTAAQNADDPLACSAILRCILAASCFGCDRVRACLADPAIRLFAGLECSPSLETVAETLLHANIAAAVAFLLDTLPHDRLAFLNTESDQAWLDYFDLAAFFEELNVDAAAAAQWSRLAQAVVRSFAARLPGFSRSSPEYLFQNFLAGISSVTTADNRIEIVPSRCPLSIVLEIAGAYHSYEFPWREGVEICLRAPSN
jgi:hypothetical protein